MLQPKLPPLHKLNITSISNMSEAEALLLLKNWRWESRDALDLDDVECPHCGCDKCKFIPKSSDKNHWANKSGNRWRCRDCYKFFSVTSGTAFAYHKLSLKQLLLVLLIWAAEAYTTSSCKLARLIGITQKNAYLFKMKINEVLLQTQDSSPMKSLVQMDGCFVTKALRFNRFLPKEEFKNKKIQKKEEMRCIIVASQKSDNKEIKGSNRTLFMITKGEHKEDILPFAKKFIRTFSEVWTDGHFAYRDLQYLYHHRFVNHSQEFITDDGVHNNYCESVNSRFRQLQSTLHKLSNLRLPYYMAEIAYRTDNRRYFAGEIVKDVCQRFFRLKPLRDWLNYTRGNRPKEEYLGMALIEHLEEKQCNNGIKPPIANKSFDVKSLAS
ncbi:IS1595 family transposase [Escherichia coli]